ncbi:MAG: tetratricopeptide repeat protein [Ketobacteraceae bacterium]|nr:tetratricopeptide repeat protein [Ketobacteraceae bacterium]
MKPDYSETDNTSQPDQWRLSHWLRLLCCVLLTGFITPAGAAFTVAEDIYKSLNSAQLLIDSDNPLKAQEILEQLKQRSALSPYEKAMIHNQLGFLHYQQNRIDQAIETFEHVIKQDPIPEALLQSTLYTLAQIYFENENYPQSIQTLKRWFAIIKNPSEDAYALLAQAYYQTDNHRLVVDNLNKALSMLEEKNLSPVEQWLVMLQSSYAELGLIEQRVSIMKWLLRIYPKKDYFLALSTAYGLLDNRSKQLSVLEIAYKEGMLDQASELLTLASLMFSGGAPYKAARVLEKGIAGEIIPASVRHLKFLASAWIDAREFEKAIPVLKRAAAMSATGEINVMVGNAYFNLGKWQQAAEAFQKALEKGSIESPEKIWLLVGQCYLRLKQFDTAEKIFEKALTFEDVRDKADQWLRYTTLEAQRYEAYQAFKATEAER